MKPEDFARGRSDVPIRFEINVKLSDVLLGDTDFWLPTGPRATWLVQGTAGGWRRSFTVNGEKFYSRDRAQVTPQGPKPGSSGGSEARFLVDWHLIALPIIHSLLSSDLCREFQAMATPACLFSAPIPSQISGDSSGHTLMPNREVTNLGEWMTGLLAHSSTLGAKIDQYLKIAYARPQGLQESGDRKRRPDSDRPVSAGPSVFQPCRSGSCLMGRSVSSSAQLC